MNAMKRYPLSLLLALAICVASLVPVPEVDVSPVRFFDKWVHFLMYGSLSLVLGFEYCRKSVRPSLGRWLVPACCLPVLLGGLLELAQAHLTTCRSGDWLDFLANAFGTFLATLGMLAGRKVAKAL